MVIIYCIEDINDLKYIGSTTQKLTTRMSQHRWEQNHDHKTKSKELNLYNCIIYPLEECEECNRKEREKYHINNIECVNKYKLTSTPGKQYYKDNKEHIKNRVKNYRENNKEKIKQYNKDNEIKKKYYNKEYYQKNIEYYRIRRKEYYQRNKK